MNRALKNRMRGRQRAPVPPLPTFGPGYIVAQYNGRANYGAGQYEVEVTKAATTGQTVSWAGGEPANSKLD